MSSFKLPDVALTPDESALVERAMGDTKILWVENLHKDPLGAMQEGGLTGKPVVISDSHCMQALGAMWRDVPIFQIPESANATQTLVERIRAESKKGDYILAIGTGTINDLCKYAAFLENKRYGVIPTAPTMNGFLSATASIKVDNLSVSMQARLPKVIACDVDILASGPPVMRAAGFGDAICRFTAQTDAYMAHLLLEHPYPALSYKILAPLDKQLALSAGALGRGNKEATKILMENLLVSGLGMVIAGGSMPASQGEHIIAHTLNLTPAIATSRTGKILHGEQIAITTITMSLLQRIWLESPSSRWMVGDWKKRSREKYWGYASKIAGYYGIDRSPSVYKEFTKKLPNDRGYEQLLGRFENQWDATRSRIMSQVPRWSPRQLHQMLREAGAPTELGQVGWFRNRFDSSLKHAHFTRDRWTFLDMAYFFGPGR